MLDFYLCAADEATMRAALPDFVREDGTWITSGHRWALDPIGPIVTTPAVIGTDGNVTAPAVIDERYHANIRLIDETLASAIPADLQVVPTNPRRVWA
jgi:hypothetical protein